MVGTTILRDAIVYDVFYTVDITNFHVSYITVVAKLQTINIIIYLMLLLSSFRSRQELVV